MARLSASLLLVVAAVFLASCSSPPPPPTETKTVTGAPPATTPAQGPRSELINLTLPAGSVPDNSSGARGSEGWRVPYARDFVVAALESQLPIGRDLDGVPWCHIYVGTTLTGWQWADAADTRWIDVSVTQTMASTAMVAISDGPGDGTGREGCDTP